MIKRSPGCLCCDDPGCRPCGGAYPAMQVMFSTTPITCCRQSGVCNPDNTDCEPIDGTYELTLINPDDLNCRYQYVFTGQKWCGTTEDWAIIIQFVQSSLTGKWKMILSIRDTSWDSEDLPDDYPDPFDCSSISSSIWTKTTDEFVWCDYEPGSIVVNGL